MKKFIPTIALLSLLALGCKQQFWTFLPDAPDNTVAVSQPANNQPEPEPTPEPETPKHIIFVLGIDGMD